jgi:cell division protein FtsQ
VLGAAAPRSRAGDIAGRLRRVARRYATPLLGWRPPPGAGWAATGLLLLASITYGVVKGDHGSMIAASLRQARDAAAGAAGFGIRSVALAGRRQLSEQEVLATAGVTAQTSVLFFDVDASRAALKAHPWIAEATVRKFYPGRIEIEIRERDAFALWQREGKISVIAADGTILGALGDRRFSVLPLVVGAGAHVRAKDFLVILARFPAIRDQVAASILVAERRWNLKLRNGIDVRLPEADPEAALARLAALDRTHRLLTRDIAMVDLRLPDRVTVRLSEAAAQAREEALKGKKQKRKGGDA